MKAHKTTISIRGMHCGGCAEKIRTALLSVDEISEASVSPQAGTADITSTAELDDSRLEDAVASAGGYHVTAVHRPGIATHSVPHRMNDASTPVADEATKESLYPLFLIVGFIAGVTLLIALSTSMWAIEPIMRHFMAGFFIVFAFFKLLDPPGFVSAYRGYDLVARHVPVWAWVYPYVELALGIAYVLAWAPLITNSVTLAIMLIGAVGVLKALLDKRAIQCACLGTALNLPMTKVTLVEDLTMAAMAAIMLAVQFTV